MAEINPGATAAALARFWVDLFGRPRDDWTDREIDAMWAAIEAALPHLTATGEPPAEDVRVDAAYLRGQKMGMEVARAHGEGGPTEYGVWRDALLISATLHSGQDMDTHNKQADVINDARWCFLHQLKAGPPAPAQPDLHCLHCGGDSDSGHGGSCPNDPAVQAAQEREETRVTETQAAADPAERDYDERNGS